MKKCLPRAKLYVGQLVVVTDHPEAQVRTIAEIHKTERGAIRAVTFLWYEGSRICSQASHPWTLHNPSLKQIEYSIEANGKLANKFDICRYLIQQAELKKAEAGEDFVA
jgi:hypothetical protein